MFSIGCSEQTLEVPLFAELYGYGQFQGRRNRGIHDPLYCRAFYFNDGKASAMIIYTDTCTSDDMLADEMRTAITQKLHIPPEGIAFVATHTHSAPPIGSHPEIGFGEPTPAFQEIWKKAVMKVAAAAVLNAEEIVRAETGRAPLAKKLGQNRVEVEKNATDETIRWIRFLRADGSCKVLLHNHGIHGIAMNLPFNKIVSADWMGAANRKIQERKLADMPLFLLGPCGDVNTYTSCHELNNDTAADVIADQYMADLEKSIAAGGEIIDDLTIRAAIRMTDFPVVEQNAAELLRDADKIRHHNAQLAFRLEEMAIMAEKGMNMQSMHDFQVIRLGKDISFLFIPGEYFVEDGAALMSRTQAKYSFAATVSNGAGGYFPSEADMKRYPDIESLETCPNNCAFGFYEIYGYMTGLKFKYQDNIAEFVSTNLLNMEKELL